MVAVAGGGADGYRRDQQLFPCGSRSQALEPSLSLRDDDVSLDCDWMVYLDRRCRALSLPFEFDAFMFLRGLSGFPSICIGLAVGAVSSLRVPFLALTVAPAAISVQARL